MLDESKDANVFAIDGFSATFKTFIPIERTNERKDEEMDEKMINSLLKTLRGMPEDSLTLPIIYGSTAKPLRQNKNNPNANPQDHTHEWRIYVRSIGNASLAPFIRKVSFKLHESFLVPVRGTPFGLFLKCSS